MKPLTIIELRAENVKRIKAVQITPNGSPVVVIGGKNGSGKTSCLDAIMYALAGKGSLPQKPVREGEEEAHIKLDIGEYTVERTIKADGTSTVKVSDNSGRLSSPQTILDGLTGNLSFDPLAFSRMEPAKQAEQLKRLVGLDFSKFDAQKAAKTEERLHVGRELRTLEGHLKNLPRHAGVGNEETSTAAIAEELRAARAKNESNAKFRSAAVANTRTYEQWAQTVKDLEAELADARIQLGKWYDAAQQAKADAERRIDVDESAIIARMSDVDAVNRKVRDNQDRARVAHEVEQKQGLYERLSKEIAAIDHAKADALSAAKFPVPSLSFDDAGVLVNGIPFQQASAAEQLRVSVAMGLALNPRLKVILVRDGSLLDDDSMDLLYRMAQDAGAQVWVERVGTGEECSVVIEAGEVMEPAAR